MPFPIVQDPTLLSLASPKARLFFCADDSLMRQGGLKAGSRLLKCGSVECGVAGQDQSADQLLLVSKMILP